MSLGVRLASMDESLFSLENWWKAALGCLSILLLWLLDEYVRRQERIQELNRWIQRARMARDQKQFQALLLTMSMSNESIEKEDNNGSKILPSATETTQLIRTRKLDMEENIIALAQRCRKYGRKEDGVNAITEELYDEALEDAKKLIQESATKTLRDFPLLYGVPISVKDCIAIKGTFSTGGLACRLNSTSKEDSLIVQVLKKAGAIPICRGNTIQLMMLPESVNRIWGRSRNPWDLSRTPGGSSGGDAALVAMDCVPLAVATDVAGSIRIPAASCGVVGFKPTASRLSGKGNMRPSKVSLVGRPKQNASRKCI